jgi:hypothetical protein
MGAPVAAKPAIIEPGSDKNRAGFRGSTSLDRPQAPPAIVPQREVRYDFIDGAPMIATCREVRSAARHREAA